MGIIKAGIGIGIIAGAFYLGYRHSESTRSDQHVRVEIIDQKPHLHYFGQNLPIHPGPRVGTLDERVHGLVMDFQEHPSETKALLGRYINGGASK